jgi:hypothetical protein
MFKNLVYMIFCCGLGFSSYFLLDQLNPFHKFMDQTRIPAALKQIKMPSSAINPYNDDRLKDKNVKKVAPLWACGCANMTEKEQARRHCSKGFTFKTMTTASEYAREHCGESCIPDCHAQVMDDDDSADL